ncbi:hypothetical protein [Saccharothrix hoggarensis]|uniref:Uncharacterized protein n=1 Tax=Saccharothrix hoggarensis TaxID=913853 RepID=A0ABW3QT82_9PSEU
MRFPLPAVDVDEFDFAAAVREHPTNRLIRWADVATAILDRHFGKARLSLTTRDGSTHLFTWGPADPAADRLQPIIDAIRGGEEV